MLSFARGRTSCRRQSLRLAIGANKKIMVHSAEQGVTVGVMRIGVLTVHSSHPALKASEGVEKSCRTRRRKRGLRVGKDRSRGGKPRRSPPIRPPNPKPPSEPSKHFTRCYVYVLKTANALYRKGCEPRLAEFDRIWDPGDRKYDLPSIVSYRKVKYSYQKLIITATRAHLLGYPELRLGRNLREFCEKRRPSDLFGLLGALNPLIPRRSTAWAATTGFGRNPEDEEGRVRHGPKAFAVELPRDPSGLRRPDTSVVRKGIERKRAVEIDRRRSQGRALTSRANRTDCCIFAGRNEMHHRDCLVGKSLVERARRCTRP